MSVRGRASLLIKNLVEAGFFKMSLPMKYVPRIEFSFLFFGRVQQTFLLSVPTSLHQNHRFFALT